MLKTKGFLALSQEGKVLSTKVYKTKRGRDNKVSKTKQQKLNRACFNVLKKLSQR